MPPAVTRQPSPWSARLPVRLSHSSDTAGRSSMLTALRAATGVARYTTELSAAAAKAISAVAGAPFACVVASTPCTCAASIACTRLLTDIKSIQDPFYSPRFSSAPNSAIAIL